MSKQTTTPHTLAQDARRLADMLGPKGEVGRAARAEAERVRAAAVELYNTSDAKRYHVVCACGDLAGAAARLRTGDDRRPTAEQLRAWADVVAESAEKTTAQAARQFTTGTLSKALDGKVRDETIAKAATAARLTLPKRGDKRPWIGPREASMIATQREQIGFKSGEREAWEQLLARIGAPEIGSKIQANSKANPKAAR